MLPRVLCLKEPLPSWNHCLLFFLSNESPSLTHNPFPTLSRERPLISSKDGSSQPPPSLRFSQRQKESERQALAHRGSGLRRAAPASACWGRLHLSHTPTSGKPRLPTSGSSRSLRPLLPVPFHLTCPLCGHLRRRMLPWSSSMFTTDDTTRAGPGMGPSQGHQPRFHSGCRSTGP